MDGNIASALYGDQTVEGAPDGPAVTRLDVTEFRCYAHARLELDGRPLVLTGPNGAGKTNLLEAVSYLAPGRGLRRAALPEVTRRGASPGSVWAVSAKVAGARGHVAIGTGLDPAAPAAASRRLVRIDGRPAAGQAELGSHLAVVWLTPQMDRLFLDPAAQRRRFLDRLVFGFHPDHAATLASYERTMRERARLLKDPRPDAGWLTALEDRMAADGIAVAAARRDVVAKLRAAAPAPTAVGSPFPQADVAMSGAVDAWFDEMPALAAEEALRRALRDHRPVDAAAGMTSDGPHRSDLVVHHADKGMPADQCSTGEQKALLIGLVLANARLLAAERGTPPLLLLDEVAAHLDAARRAALFEQILMLGAQAWLTGTDAQLFDAFGDRAQRITIVDAVVTASA